MRNNLSNFEKMEDPEDREVKDIVHSKKGKQNYKKKSFGSLSSSTAKHLTFMMTLLFWMCFITGAILLIAKVLSAYAG